MVRWEIRRVAVSFNGERKAGGCNANHDVPQGGRTIEVPPQAIVWRILVKSAATCSDSLIDEFTSPSFRVAFRRYFTEFGYEVSDWDGLFASMGADGEHAWVRVRDDGSVVGFIMFNPIAVTSSFFEETMGFVREFWVAAEYRNQGYGAALLRLAERWFVSQGIRTAVLTTDTAERFYRRHGYVDSPACKARNGCPVFVRHLPATM